MLGSGAAGGILKLCRVRRGEMTGRALSEHEMCGMCVERACHSIEAIVPEPECPSGANFPAVVPAFRGGSGASQQFCRAASFPSDIASAS